MTARHPVTPRRPAAAGRVLVALLVVAAAGILHASSPPHWTSTTLTMDCSACHAGHNAAGGGLTTSATNVNLCQSCHVASGMAGDLPINSVDEAVPGVSGRGHAFDVPAVNASLDTQSPQATDMLLRVSGGNIVCSTCHDQHWAVSSKRGTPRISSPKRTTALGSTGTLSSGGTFTGAQGLWYLVKISLAGNETTAKFVWSTNNGSTWQPEQTAGTNRALNNGVTVTFGAGSYSLNEKWEFYGAWPFLQTPMDQGTNAAGDHYCRDCHRSWKMDHTATRTWDGTYKSHPIGVTLNANAAGYDRATVLDGNGAAQGSGSADTNKSNNYWFDAGNRISCPTCHGVHYADGNTQTDDGP